MGIKKLACEAPLDRKIMSCSVSRFDASRCYSNIDDKCFSLSFGGSNIGEPQLHKRLKMLAVQQDTMLEAVTRAAL